MPEVRPQSPHTLRHLGRSTIGQLDDDVRIAQNFTPYTPQEMEDLAKLAVTAGPAALKDLPSNTGRSAGEWK